MDSIGKSHCKLFRIQKSGVPAWTSQNQRSQFKIRDGERWELVNDPWFPLLFSRENQGIICPSKTLPKKRKPLNWKNDNSSHPGVLSGSKTRNESVIDARMRGRKWTNTWRWNLALLNHLFWDSYSNGKTRRCFHEPNRQRESLKGFQNFSRSCDWSEIH